ncbi:MAG: hypothetical protein IJW40_11585 [Clostridia bacterium]|nr:hypothetical protein [Clostridia bacterium]
MIFTFDTWQISVDLDAMQTAVHWLPLCDCRACRTFAAYVRALPDSVKQPFSALGLDMTNPDEVFDAGTDEDGQNQYGGWWNLYGHIVKEGEAPYAPIDGMEVTFAEDGTCVPAWFGPSCLQMRFTVKGDRLKRLGKEYHAQGGTLAKDTFIYRVEESKLAQLQGLVGRELIGVTLASPINGAPSPLFHAVDFVVKSASEDGYRKVSLRVARDLDTCHEGIDRMSLTLHFNGVATWEQTNTDVDCPRGRIQAIKLFESTIEGEQDRVVYDSHILLELDGGDCMAFRAEPDGAKALQPFMFLKSADMERFLRVSDTWFTEDDPFYRTNTVLRWMTQRAV